MNRAGQRTDPPLVTFLVVAYNQEDFIREAIEGAFSQTYEHLEIVLSDDCSTDQTFHVMQEMLSGYDGPHAVRAIRNPTNMGVLRHTLVRGKEASGQIVIGSAGDDISEPERTTRVVEAFEANPRAGCVCSWVTWMDENGDSIAGKQQPRITRQRLVLRDDDNGAVAMIGCSASYRKWVFDIQISPQASDCAEDMVLAFYLDLQGADVVTIQSALVRYRIHSGALTNIIPSATQYERINYRSAVARIHFLAECEIVADTLGKKHLLDFDELNRAMSAARDIKEWPELSAFVRFNRTLRVDFRSGWRPAMRRLIWGCTRLWGRFPGYQPRLFLSRFRKKYRD